MVVIWVALTTFFFLSTAPVVHYCTRPDKNRETDVTKRLNKHEVESGDKVACLRGTLTSSNILTRSMPITREESVMLWVRSITITITITIFLTMQLVDSSRPIEPYLLANVSKRT